MEIENSEENELSMRTACRRNISAIQKLRILQNLILSCYMVLLIEGMFKFWFSVTSGSAGELGF